MVKYLVNSRDVRIYDVDYLLEDSEKFLKLIPYLKKKIEGEWRIAILEPDIQFVRKVEDENLVPDFVTLELYLDKSVAERLITERPKLFVEKKTPYEKYLDTIGELKVLIESKAATDLYRRVGVNKEKLSEYLVHLASTVDGIIKVSDVRREVPDERKVYSSDVINSFIMHDRYRWKKYETLVSELGTSYAYYSMRKYTERLIAEKNRYLLNEETELRNIDKLNAPGICLAYMIFHTTKVSELDLCMYLLDNKEMARRIL